MARKKTARKKSGKKEITVAMIMRSKTWEELQALCRKKKIPYGNLTKQQLAENLLARYEGRALPYKAAVKTHQQNVDSTHTITPQIRQFCFEYALIKKAHTHAQWAKKYGVAVATIQQWLQWDQVKVLIERFQTDREARMLEIFAQNEVEVTQELVLMALGEEMTELKRKAINDFLGLAGRVNVNRGAKVLVAQNQAQGQSVAIPATEEELDAELEELAEHLQQLPAVRRAAAVRRKG